MSVRKYSRSFMGLPKWGYTFFFLSMSAVCIGLGAAELDDDRGMAVGLLLAGIGMLAATIYYIVARSQVRIDDARLEIRGLLLTRAYTWTEIQSVGGQRESNYNAPPSLKAQIITTAGKRTTIHLGYRKGLDFLKQLQSRGVQVFSDAT
jgi:hypothetical protein